MLFDKMWPSIEERCCFRKGFSFQSSSRRSAGIRSGLYYVPLCCPPTQPTVSRRTRWWTPACPSRSHLPLCRTFLKRSLLKSLRASRAKTEIGVTGTDHSGTADFFYSYYAFSPPNGSKTVVVDTRRCRSLSRFAAIFFQSAGSRGLLPWQTKSKFFWKDRNFDIKWEVHYNYDNT